MDHPAWNSAGAAYRAERLAGPRHGGRRRMVAIDCPREPAGSISVLVKGNLRVLRLAGEVDAATVDAFDGPPTDPAGPTGTGAFTVVDVSEVTFIDCHGLRFVLRQTEATVDRSTRPVLLQAPVSVRRILELTGLTHLFDLEP